MTTMGNTEQMPLPNDPNFALKPRVFEPLPLGAVRPAGWLRDQLRVQANGLTGHLDEFWPSIAQSRWIGGNNEGWERTPYWLDGLIPLAVLLADERLLAKARHWIDYILAHQHADGWLGSKNDPHAGTGEVVLDAWPQFILFKALTQWQEATGDPRIVPAMLRAMRRIDSLLAEKPLSSWGRMRWADLALSAHWLYERTQDALLLRLTEAAHRQGYDWQGHFDEFRYTERTDGARLGLKTHDDWLPLHGVNNAMGVKSGAVWARQSGSLTDAHSSLNAVTVLDKYHGQVTGVFSGDEHLAGLSPVQGTETCTVTEYLYTLEQMLALTGEPLLGDRLERIAFNALPAATTADMCARQYDQQPNQVLCTVARRDWVSNGPDSNLFSLEGHFGCCTANLHQGWPKFASHLWMRTKEGGLVAAAYAPSVVTAEVAGVAVTIQEETEYPFQEEIVFTMQTQKAVSFPLLLRVPAWADGASVRINAEAALPAVPGTFHRIERSWASGDVVTLRVPMAVRQEKRLNGAVSVLRGPLVMALSVGAEFHQIGRELPYADWEAHPTTPWNYALAGDNFTARFAPISAIPFHSETPPVTLVASGRLLPEWGLSNDSAAPPPLVLPGDVEEPVAITLVPYGSAPLRISEFPDAR